MNSLLPRVARGDRAALREIYEAQASRLFGIALAILRDRDAAADALHDAFVKVARAAGQFDPARGSAEAWLAAIVRHAALDLARARGREIPAEGLPEPAEEATQLHSLASAQDGVRLRECLATLEEKNRTEILLAFVNGLSHPQVAARLDVPLGTAKAWIRRGLLSLRECLA
ncbi:sigma-70 family RNA polymerase sigma factor [Sabulicella glaciei]|uniref:Sigma-70 family RNA polymerase sigma factor n=1 Tax=Sabulicella glaciei TaxID=2984948 RepID=A0ABT3NYH5_9PROT|nr:sigma-70 family RNA polymerase sigma factor [Roseococcus sp. MDT2-1-1]